MGAETLVGAAVLAYSHSRLSKLIPVPTTPLRPLSQSLLPLSPAGPVLSLEYTGTPELPWCCPILTHQVCIDPAVQRSLQVHIPLAADTSGKIRAFRPFAYMEKLIMRLDEVGVKVGNT